jgi:hypothetical protein
MMLDITPDDSGGEMRIDLLRFHVSGFRHTVFSNLHMGEPVRHLFPWMFFESIAQYRDDFLLNLRIGQADAIASV